MRARRRRSPTRPFAAELARARSRPALLWLPAWPLRWVAGDLARALVLGGERVIPDEADARRKD